jgi:integrase
MRRTKGQGSLIQVKGSTFWQARYYDGMGRKISVSTKTTVKMEAEKFLRKRLAEIDNGSTPLGDVRKLKYANLRAGLLASYTEKGNKSLLARADGEETVMGLPQLDAFFKYSSTNPGPSVLQLTTDTARAFVKQRQSEGAGTAVINRSLACLRRMLSIAYKEGRLPAKPQINLLKEPPARGGFVELAEFDCLVKHLPAHLKPYVTFLYHCGGRSGEAKLITWDQVDLNRRIIRLEGAQTKNNEGRAVPLHSTLVPMLQEMYKKAERGGRVFDTTNLRKEWARACVACKLGRKIEVEGKKHDPRYEGLTLHDLRRSAARNLVNAGVPEGIVMKIGGWKTRSVFDRYNVSSTADITAAMERWEVASLALQSQAENANQKALPGNTDGN